MSRHVSKSLVVPSPHDGEDHYLDALHDIVNEFDVDLVIPVSEETLYVSKLLDRGVPVFCTPHEHTLILHDKWLFAEFARNVGLAVPETVIAGDHDQDVRSTAHVLKPRLSCSGRGVQFQDAGALPLENHDHVLQRRIDGEDHSVFCIAHRGEVIACVEYTPALLDGSVSIAFSRVDADSACQRWARDFVEASAHTGFIAFDFIVDQSGKPWALECNPRATSGLHFLRQSQLFAAVSGRPLEGGYLRDEALLAESWSCFTALLGSLVSSRSTRHAWRVLRDSTDISRDGKDPWPFLLMMINSWRLLALAMTPSHSFASAAVADVEWIPDAGR